MNFAQSFLGTPYRWAGESPSGFDCSGFTRYVFGKFGVSLPHSAAAQFSCGTPVQRSELAPGDLLLFHTLSPGIDHAAIYCGGGRFIHASSRGGCVKTDSLNENYWDTHLVGARRVL
ncbi:MAG: C40 family peptidase [Candidatus Zixiibacteriota bacterium]